MCEAKWTQHDILQYLTDMYRLTCFACLSHPWSLFDRYMAPELFDSKGKITEKARGDFLGCVVKEEAKTKKKQENHTAHRSCSFLLRMLLKWCVAFFLHGFCFLFLVAVHFLHVCYIVSWFLPGFCTFLFHRSSSMFHSKLVTVATCFEDDYPCIGVSDGSTVQIKASRNWSHWKKHVKSIVFPATCVTCRIEAGGCLGFGMLGGGSHLQSPPSWGWCYLVLDVC